ncbi:MAG: malto-oligosyltrehalose trehalohydrolase, partial [Betaproteobacteria bacterium]
MPFGAEVRADGRVRFRLWAPAAAHVELVLCAPHDRAAREPLPMHRCEDGFHELITGWAHPGSRYRFRIDGRIEVADPASRANPDDVRGASEVIDPCAFAWDDTAWPGRPWHEAVIYELHVGTFTPAGRFLSAVERVPYLAALGVTAVELMPIADFPGARNWG